MLNNSGEILDFSGIILKPKQVINQTIRNFIPGQYAFILNFYISPIFFYRHSKRIICYPEH